MRWESETDFMHGIVRVLAAALLLAGTLFLSSCCSASCNGRWWDPCPRGDCCPIGDPCDCCDPCGC